MVIDFHTHIFPDKIADRSIRILEDHADVKAATNGKKEGLLRSMEEGNIDISIILPVVTNPEQFESIHQFAVNLNEAFVKQEIPTLISFGGIHPEMGDYKERLKEIKESGLKGIKLHPDYQKAYIDDISNKRIIDYASELDLITVVHAGVDIGLPEKVHATPERIHNLIKDVQPEKLVLAHYGSYDMWNEVEEYLVGENVYFDTSYTLGFIQEEQFLRILRKHGSEKILFATDSPWGGQKEMLEAFCRLPITEEEKENILWKNAIELLGLQI